MKWVLHRLKNKRHRVGVVGSLLSLRGDCSFEDVVEIEVIGTAVCLPTTAGGSGGGIASHKSPA